MEILNEAKQEVPSALAAMAREGGFGGGGGGYGGGGRGGGRRY